MYIYLHSTRCAIVVRKNNRDAVLEQNPNEDKVKTVYYEALDRRLS